MAKSKSHSSASCPSISTTLLNGLRNGDRQAWDKLDRLFRPLVVWWCLRSGVPQKDADDVTQDVFTSVFTNLPKFHRDQAGDTFSGWLRTIAKSKVCDYFRARGRSWGPEPPAPSEHAAPGEPVPSGEVVAAAMESIRGDFTEAVWLAFWGLAIDERSAAEIGEELGMTPGAVYQARRRVRKRLCEELEGFLPE